MVIRSNSERTLAPLEYSNARVGCNFCIFSDYEIKKMDFLPQGVEALKRWVRSLNYPLVAIGGITLERGRAILSAGADAVAVVRDVTLNPDPDKRVKEWLSLIDNYS